MLIYEGGNHSLRKPLGRAQQTLKGRLQGLPVCVARPFDPSWTVGSNELASRYRCHVSTRYSIPDRDDIVGKLRVNKVGAPWQPHACDACMEMAHWWWTHWLPSCNLPVGYEHATSDHATSDEAGLACAASSSRVLLGSRLISILSRSGGQTRKASIEAWSNTQCNIKTGQNQHRDICVSK